MWIGKICCGRQGVIGRGTVTLGLEGEVSQAGEVRLRCGDLGLGVAWPAGWIWLGGLRIGGMWYGMVSQARSALVSTGGYGGIGTGTAGKEGHGLVWTGESGAVGLGRQGSEGGIGKG